MPYFFRNSDGTDILRYFQNAPFDEVDIKRFTSGALVACLIMYADQICHCFPSRAYEQIFSISGCRYKISRKGSKMLIGALQEALKNYVTIEIYDYTLDYCIIHFHLNKGLCWREIYTALKLSGVKGLPELGKKKC